MIQKFKTKPIEVEAIQWNGNSNKEDIENFVGIRLNTELESETAYLAGIKPPIFSLLIETEEGLVKAFKGDWIVKENDLVYVHANETFKNNYDLVTPKIVLDAQKYIDDCHKDMGFIGSPEYYRQHKIVDDFFESIKMREIEDEEFSNYLRLKSKYEG